MNTLAELLALPMRIRPDAVAIRMLDQQISFRAIEVNARRISKLLISKYNIESGDRIIVLAEKRPSIVVLAYAIWKANCIYVPVDVKSPSLRLRHIVDSIHPKLIIASHHVLTDLAGATNTVPSMAFEDIEADHSCDAGTPLPIVTDDKPAIIIHTSGSTGTPKGVVLTHKSIITYFYNHNSYLKFDGGSVGMNNGPFHFDVSIQDTFLPLYFGSTVVFHGGIFVSLIMIDLILKNRVTHLIAVSSVLDLISRDTGKFVALEKSNLQVLVTGGEVCSPSLINRWLETIPGLRALYGYGPTECNSLCLTFEISLPDTNRVAPYPIGSPFRGMKAALFDESGSILPQSQRKGVLGIAGPQLMAGYWGDPEMTRRVFRSIDGDTYYITGDYCTCDDQGIFSFVGRIDSEVKILGRRINLNEVRNAIMNHPGVSYAAVGTIENQSEVRIAAFVVAEGGRVSYQDLRRATDSWLLDYMRPYYIGIVSTPPRTATGKIDEKFALRTLRDSVLRNPAVREVRLALVVAEANDSVGDPVGSVQAR
jgi:amino acid adenylation domain-containing protein